MTNFIELCGDVATPPVLSHENHGVAFYTFVLCVKRLSGAEDLPNIIAPAHHIAHVEPGRRIHISGQLRSYNNRGGAGNRLQISAWAKVLEPTACDYQNHVALTGILCRQPIYRCTPYGREITDLMLCVERPGTPAAVRRYDYLPCVTWGSVARMCATAQARSRVSLTGRLQSRRYIKVEGSDSVPRTAYEVSVSDAELF